MIKSLTTTGFNSKLPLSFHLLIRYQNNLYFFQNEIRVIESWQNILYNCFVFLIQGNLNHTSTSTQCKLRLNSGFFFILSFLSYLPPFSRIKRLLIFFLWWNQNDASIKSDIIVKKSLKQSETDIQKYQVQVVIKILVTAAFNS